MTNKIDKLNEKLSYFAEQHNSLMKEVGKIKNFMIEVEVEIKKEVELLDVNLVLDDITISSNQGDWESSKENYQVDEDEAVFYFDSNNRCTDGAFTINEAKQLCGFLTERIGYLQSDNENELDKLF